MSRLRKKTTNSSLRGGSNAEAPSNKKRRTLDLGWKNDEHIDSSSEGEDNDNAVANEDSDIEQEETLDSKKVRLAREYLRKLEAGGSDGSSTESSSSDDDDNDDGDNSSQGDYHDSIGRKLQHERLKREGTLERNVADKVQQCLETVKESFPATKSAERQAEAWISKGYVKLLRGHDLTPTCVALQSTGEKAISGSKDHAAFLWDIETEKRETTLWHNRKQQDRQEPEMGRTAGEVLSVACSDDGRYAAIGRRNATVSIFDIRAGKTSLIKTFEGHKGPVTCLGFRTQSLQLFSGSDDRCIRHYNLSEMMYVETLYGHQFGVTGIDCHRKERPISVGRDRTARAWKLSEDSHLIFRGGAKLPSADCVSVIKDDWFLTGHENGQLGLWLTEKKKAVKTYEYAHGVDGAVGRGIACIGTLKGADLALTGSHDGFLRLWKVMSGLTLGDRGLEPLGQIPLTGFINGVALGPKARFCVAALGQEPRLGRWSRISKAKNRFAVVQLRPDDADDDASYIAGETAPGMEDEDFCSGDSDSS